MKKIMVNESLCIGCGACVAIDPNHFDFNSQGLSTAKIEDVENIDQNLASAVESCPTNAIKIAETENDTIQEMPEAA